MARAKVVHSEDAVLIEFKGDRRNPEPTTAVIKFPGGHVEVSRCSDGTYWAHLTVVEAANIVDGRVDYDYGASASVRDFPEHEKVHKVALRVANVVPHFDPDEEPCDRQPRDRFEAKQRRDEVRQAAKDRL